MRRRRCRRVTGPRRSRTRFSRRPRPFGSTRSLARLTAAERAALPGSLRSRRDHATALRTLAARRSARVARAPAALHERLGKPTARGICSISIASSRDRSPPRSTTSASPSCRSRRRCRARNVYPHDATREEIEAFLAAQSGSTRRNPRGAYRRPPRDAHEHQRRHRHARTLRAHARAASRTARAAACIWQIARDRIRSTPCRIRSPIQTNCRSAFALLMRAAKTLEPARRRVRALPAQPRARPRHQRLRERRRVVGHRPLRTPQRADRRVRDVRRRAVRREGVSQHEHPAA